MGSLQGSTSSSLGRGVVQTFYSICAEHCRLEPCCSRLRLHPADILRFMGILNKKHAPVPGDIDLRPIERLWIHMANIDIS
jgi:hypothetical protein